jgi:hypothetical protein
MIDRASITGCVSLVALAGAVTVTAAETVALPAYTARLSGWCESVEQEPVNSGRAGSDFRVRRGGKLAASGQRQTIFVDDGGEVAFNGRSSTIYVASGGRATVSGERNHVFAAPGARVLSVGAQTVVSVPALELRVNPTSQACQ